MAKTARILASIVIAGIALAGCLDGGDRVPTAAVGGQTYLVSVMRGLVVTEDDLVPYGRMVRAVDPSIFLDDQAYALRGVDGRDFLVVRAKPGLTDDAGSWGDFIGLFGDGQNPALCRYVGRLGPPWCDPTPSATGE